MLVYVGKGTFLPGIPARDLSEDEIKKGGWDVKKLVRSGLYAFKARRPKVEDKAIRPEISDKERMTWS